MMPSHTALAVANEFLRLRADAVQPAQMQLQKLVFNAHGWNLAINLQPLVREHAQAWDNGPVYRSIWDHIRDHGHQKGSCLLIDPITHEPFTAKFTEDEREVIKRTWDKYGSFSGMELSRMAHEPNAPWTRAYFNRGRNSALSDIESRDYYRSLALAGRVG